MPHLINGAFSRAGLYPKAFSLTHTVRRLMRLLRFTFTLIAALIVSHSLAVADPADKSQIEQIVRDYILENPEIIEEALGVLQTRAQEAEAKARASAVAAEQNALFQSENDLVMGNPDGDVTLVEFFDFNCGYCKRAAPDVQALVASDPNLRVVLKDFPILGEQSVEAAKVGLAVKRLMGATVAGEFHKKLIGLQGRADGRRAMELAQELGADRRRLEDEAAGKEVEAIIAKNLALAQRLGLTGTPTFIVGDSVIQGAVGVAPLRGAIKAVRK
ncbi:DsbA family protein [Shinella sumterensis]|uniref:Protein-disulfide isomerase n=1 Tax=Rhizobium subbaraonis TaxID=908946 RepID=A0A285USR8_9HYPH|nr:MULTISPECIES: DsbA family protein [Rhizobiaceae]WLS08803.1 DsbA family protein [Shinella sumterensis]SOC44890.1 protein-disulfide isomerase [Rhizobium subbaraonis]